MMIKNRIQFVVLLFLLLSCEKRKDSVDHLINQYDSIRLISYDKARIGDALQIKKGTIRISNIKFIDDLILDGKYSKQILSVITSKSDVCSVADCYNPRHILLFYKKNKVAGFYEFCVECGNSSKSDNLKLQSICTEQGDTLIEIFKEMKLKNDGEEDENYQYF